MPERNSSQQPLALPASGKDWRPLADRMRPQRLEEYVGQTHLLGAGKPLQDGLQRAVTIEAARALLNDC